jgi:hypothetical protein
VIAALDHWNQRAIYAATRKSAKRISFDSLFQLNLLHWLKHFILISNWLNFRIAAVVCINELPNAYNARAHRIVVNSSISAGECAVRRLDRCGVEFD